MPTSPKFRNLEGKRCKQRKIEKESGTSDKEEDKENKENRENVPSGNNLSEEENNDMPTALDDDRKRKKTEQAQDKPLNMSLLASQVSTVKLMRVIKLKFHSNIYKSLRITLILFFIMKAITIIIKSFSFYLCFLIQIMSKLQTVIYFLYCLIEYEYMLKLQLSNVYFHCKYFNFWAVVIRGDS